MPNKATAEVKAACQELLDEPTYRGTLKRRLLTGKLAPLECLLWYYADGKPEETQDLRFDSRDQSIEASVARAEELLAQLKQP